MDATGRQRGGGIADPCRRSFRLERLDGVAGRAQQSPQLGADRCVVEDPEILELPPFHRLSGKSRIRQGIFAGPKQFSAALTELERQAYQQRA